MPSPDIFPGLQDLTNAARTTGRVRVFASRGYIDLDTILPPEPHALRISLALESANVVLIRSNGQEATMSYDLIRRDPVLFRGFNRRDIQPIYDSATGSDAHPSVGESLVLTLAQELKEKPTRNGTRDTREIVIDHALKVVEEVSYRGDATLRQEGISLVDPVLRGGIGTTTASVVEYTTEGATTISVDFSNPSNISLTSLIFRPESAIHELRGKRSSLIKEGSGITLEPDNASPHTPYETRHLIYVVYRAMRNAASAGTINLKDNPNANQLLGTLTECLATYGRRGVKFN